jgi:exonuclease SbcD
MIVTSGVGLFRRRVFSPIEFTNSKPAANMKILHTSDWHIGQELFGWSRQIEHDDFFDQLEELIIERGVDALVIAGDVFDHQNPSSSALRVFYEAMARFRRARPDLTTVVIAGNHDAAGRIEAPHALLAAFGVHVVGSVQRREGGLAPDHHAIPLRNARGEIAAWVAALPFLRPTDLPPFRRDAEGSPIVDAVRTLYAEAAEVMVSLAAGAPFILTGHLHVAGGLESEGAERRILVGGEHAVPPDIFPSSAAYVALGHLHRPQQVGDPRIRYSGSPFPMSATERNYQHGVTLIDTSLKQVAPEHVVFKRRIPFIRIPADGVVELAAAGDVLQKIASDLGLDSSMPRWEQPFVQLVLKGSGSRSDLERLVGELPLRVVSIRNERELVAEASAMVTAERLVDLDPEAVFGEAFLRTHGSRPEPQHLAVFHQALAEG